MIYNSEGDIIIIGGARDFHAVEWYRVMRSIAHNRRVILVTDTMSSEGMQCMVNASDNVIRLCVIDTLLFERQGRLAHIWRNGIKLAALPLQALALRWRLQGRSIAAIHCHPMYYMFVAWVAGLRFVGTPQGSEILVRPFRSILYRIVAKRLLREADFVTVDSKRMQRVVAEMSGVYAKIVQNGIDVKMFYRPGNKSFECDHILSVRGVAPLYRIGELFAARKRENQSQRIEMIYPFKEADCHDEIKRCFRTGDVDHGRLSKTEMMDLLCRSRLVVTVPLSDSSPKTIYEAIFSGCCIAATYEGWIGDLPRCMRARVIVVRLDDPRWLSKALEFAEKVWPQGYCASAEALEMFDRDKNMKWVIENVYNGMKTSQAKVKETVV